MKLGLLPPILLASTLAMARADMDHFTNVEVNNNNNQEKKKPQRKKGLRQNRHVNHDREERLNRIQDFQDMRSGERSQDATSQTIQERVSTVRNERNKRHIHVDISTTTNSNIHSDGDSSVPVHIAGNNGHRDLSSFEARFNHDHGRARNNNYSTRIVGGQEADPHEYPYYVDMFGCGGSLIAPRVVLSAAHCGDYMGSNVIVSGYRASTTDEGADMITVQDQAEHPSYNPGTDENDFTLLLLAEDANLGFETNIVLSLDDSGLVDSLNQGDPMTVVGLGRTSSTGSTADTLREVVVPYVDDDSCRVSYASDFVDANMHCAGTGGKDSCQGDSGGPIVVINGNNHIQTGVVSWGIGCAEPGFPGVYAKVSSAETWIKTVVCDEWNVDASFCSGGDTNTPPPTTNTPPPTTNTPPPTTNTPPPTTNTPPPTTNTPPPTTNTPPPTTNTPECFELQFVFQADDWPEENDFFMIDASGNIVWDESSFSLNSLNVYSDGCLDVNGCYALDFSDSYGDGLLNGGYISLSINGEEKIYMSSDVGSGATFYFGNGCSTY